MYKYTAIVDKIRNSFNCYRTRSYEFRISQLKALFRLVEENEELFAESLKTDLSKPYLEALLGESTFVKNDILDAMHNLKDWMKEEKVERNVMTMMDSVYIRSEPYGVTLIIGPWNYPMLLMFSPLVGAIAAGNCAVLKPSEIASATSKLIGELVPKYLDTDCFVVIEGGATDTQELLKEKFDHIFYTGSEKVGQIVYEAAAKHLTPVTLELGGKSPVYMDDSINMDYAVRRLLWGKFMNAGQTCVAPDYLMCSRQVQDEVVERVKKNLKDWYGEDLKKSADFGRIVNANHFNRIVKLLDSGNIAVGGDYDIDDKYIAPTVLTDVKPTDPVMQEEIFGPVLPIIVVDGVDEAIDIIKSRPHPLSAYVFSSKNDVFQRFKNQTTSGALVGNDTVIHLSVLALPFGGVGSSGIGSYHGKFSFDAFSHKKSVLVRNYFSLNEKIGGMRYPPYSLQKLKMTRFFLTKRKSFNMAWLSYVAVFSLGVATMFLLHTYAKI